MQISWQQYLQSKWTYLYLFSLAYAFESTQFEYILKQFYLSPGWVSFIIIRTMTVINRINDLMMSAKHDESTVHVHFIHLCLALISIQTSLIHYYYLRLLLLYILLFWFNWGSDDTSIVFGLFIVSRLNVSKMCNSPYIAIVHKWYVFIECIFLFVCL